LQEAAGEEITLEINVNGKKIDVLRFAEDIDSKNDSENFMKITDKRFSRRMQYENNYEKMFVCGRVHKIIRNK